MSQARRVFPRALCATLLALSALAFLPGASAAQGDGQRAVQVVTRTLQLDEAQVQQWQQIRTNTAAAVEPLADQVRALEADLQELLDGDDPDAGAVGDLVLQIRDLRQQIRALGQSATDQFEALLSEEQTGRLNAVRRAARLQPVIPAFRLLHLLRD